ncbi:substrate-binding domain-containing protein [Bacteroides gallinaceum]|uniref:Substrate-binding domain-containing protein n=1 Tax=Candidatus Phocaeicola excrementipullorum TaxID=2838731 RepID=A0A948TKC5_9BACT|nr:MULTISPECIES: substrate-binding domain-containing protein [Bacteroides]MBU3854961.1 substrate-binding domain-containing protein [Candidatus Phocaeicola excrementipullorum]MCR8917047.1 substrate-binding domain-containing protein [Bacteroides sp. ET225]MDM8208458.1 substrate-binding domain-containing protein [Bacteroides gallinaceum]
MKRVFFLCCALSLLLASCGGQKKTDGETMYSGDIKIAVDESFKPIMEEELQVYRALTPEANVTPIYCSEVEAINLLLKDSVRLVIANRRLTENELASFHARKFFPESIRMAVSGIALITNPANTDSLLTVGQFRNILTGKITEWKELYPQSKLGKLQVVFDNPNSGLIHYAIDSICEGQKLASTLTALKSNEEVIDYVSKTPGAMGVIGANWIGNVSDSTRLSFNESVRVMAVSNSGHATVANSFKPYQAYLALRQYPLTHDVFILVNDPRNGLPTGLMTFLTKDRGQRIILKSGLVPATQPVRLVNVKDEF